MAVTLHRHAYHAPRHAVAQPAPPPLAATGGEGRAQRRARGIERGCLCILEAFRATKSWRRTRHACTPGWVQRGGRGTVLAMLHIAGGGCESASRHNCIGLARFRKPHALEGFPGIPGALVGYQGGISGHSQPRRRELCCWGRFSQTPGTATPPPAASASAPGCRPLQSG